MFQALLLFSSATLATACNTGYSQCGGQGWAGATCCVTGYTCQFSTQYYSQCLPPTGATTTSAPASSPTCNQIASIKAISFNDRVPVDTDINSWTNRKPMVISLLASNAPHIFGLQESVPTQRQEILAGLTGYQFTGNGREADLSGEGTPIYYNTKYLTLKTTETFWLSDTPSVAGSKTWGNNYPRIATIAEFTATGSATNLPGTVVVNTHLDHEVPDARLKGAQLICSRVQKYLSASKFVVLLGDFNNAASNAPEILALKGCGFFDSHPNSEATFHAFTGTGLGTKMDFIMVQSPFNSKVLSSTILKDNTSGRYPSDHFALRAEFQLTKTC